jgi:two-component system CheB/CheR fusion protein
VVGVGASAGGLEAFRELLARVPADAGLAFVLVQHLGADRASLLGEALAQATTLPVTQAEHGVRVEPNHVYVIPPGVQLTISQGILQLAQMAPEERRPHLPIDHFLRSLAAERGRQAIGVILSGTGADGAAGLGAIRADGGITFAQDPATARFAEMPRSAVEAGVVDFCLPLAELGAELARLARHPYLARSEPKPPTPAGAGSFAEVVTTLRSATGVDFGEYKPATLQRRLARRMALRKVQDLPTYLGVLRQDPVEVRTLFEDLLIKVTSFFRDPESFDDLKSIAFPAILANKPAGAPIRAWVIGCASGEEVYSLAMALSEHLGAGRTDHPVTIFGSDLSEQAIEQARAGHYTEAEVEGLGEERLKRFFVRTEKGWRVSQALRELCVFVRHDVARDPPFSKMDLLSCRNVLIYFGQALQRRVLGAAHYSLNQPGYLLLGRAESAAGVPRWFTPVSEAGRIFIRRPGPSTFRFAPRTGSFPGLRPAASPFAGLRLAASLEPTGVEMQPHPRSDGELARHVGELLLARYAPAGVIVNERMEVLHFRGRTGPYLEQPQGAPQNQLLKLARVGLVSPLRLAFDEARRTSAPVRKERVVIERGEQSRTCDLVVLPISPPAGEERAFAVLFEERPRSTPGRAAGKQARLDPAERLRLEEELTATRDQVAALLEEHTRSHEVLASGNDDLVSSNEELQGLNEELETAKEEVQASNEELATLNDELLERNQELKVVGADVLGLLEAVEIPILMLDQEHRIRRFTVRASEFLGITAADVGRPIGEVILPVQAPDLEPWINRAMAGGVLVEAEVQDRDGRWHRLQVRPRRGPGGQPEGAILSLVDIDRLRNELTLAQWARDYARSIVEAVQVPQVVLDAHLHVISANAAYYRQFHGEATSTEGRPFFEVAEGSWDTPELHRAVVACGQGGERFQALEVERELPGGGRGTFSASGCQVASPIGESMLLVAIEDVTERRAVERNRAELLVVAERALRAAELAERAKDQFLANLSHELRTPLTTILIHAQALRRDGLDGPAAAAAGAAIEVEARRQVRLVEDLLDVSAIVSGKLTLALVEFDWRGLVQGVVEAARPEAEAKGLRLTAELGEGSPDLLGDPGRLRQVVSNLIANAVKFTPVGGQVDVRVEAADGFAGLTVTDSGQGIASPFLARVFDRFAQEGVEDGPNPGLGLGLAIVHDLVDLHGGSVEAASPGRDRGATFTVRLPRRAGPASGA